VEENPTLTNCEDAKIFNRTGRKMYIEDTIEYVSVLLEVASRCVSIYDRLST